MNVDWGTTPRNLAPNSSRNDCLTVNAGVNRDDAVRRRGKGQAARRPGQAAEDEAADKRRKVDG